MKDRNGILLTIILGLMSIVFTLSSDIFSENEYDLFLPFTTLFYGNDNLEVDDLLPSDDITEKDRYIFIIDKSKSTDGQIDKPIWYDDICKKIASKTYLDIPKSIGKTDSKFNISKLILYNLIMDLKDSVKFFSVLSVGNKTGKIFPENILFDQSLPKNKTIAIKNVIETQNDQDETNFVDLFNNVYENHIKNMDEKAGKNSSNIILVLISDMVHSIKTMSTSNFQKNKKIQNATKELIIASKKIATTDLFTNVIIFQQDRNSKVQDSYIDIPCDTVLNRIFEDYKINISDINEANNYILYKNINSHRAINFYYENPINIENSEVTINVEDLSGNYQIELLNAKNKNLSNTIKYTIANIDGNPKNNREFCYQKLLPGFPETLRDINRNENIKLQYSGPKPLIVPQPKLKINIPDSRNLSLIIPINFVRKMSLIHSLSIIFLSIFLLYFLGENIKWKWKKENSKSAESNVIGARENERESREC